MENGTAGAQPDDGATSATSDSRWLYTVWKPGPLFVSDHANTPDWKAAKREAAAIGGFITRQEIVGDYRR